MISQSRRQIRLQFTALLEEALVGEGKLAQSIFPYRVSDFSGASPVLVVSSHSSQRSRITFQVGKPTFGLQVDWFVLYSDLANGWNESDAENRLDEIEQAISEVIENHRSLDGFWDNVIWNVPSERVDVTIGGVDYIREYVQLEFS